MDHVIMIIEFIVPYATSPHARVYGIWTKHVHGSIVVNGNHMEFRQYFTKPIT